MKHCEKCIHYELCKSRMECAPDDTFSFFPYNEDCPHFKNKSDYAEVKHGGWTKTGDRKLDILYAGRKCSECGYVYCGDLTNYCPNCGAKMDGGSV